MINGMVNIAPDHLIIRLQYPDGTESAPVNVKDESEATRLVYFHNRIYITDKLKSWLNQRLYAFRVSNSIISGEIANELLLNLTVFNKTSLHKLCHWVTRHEDAIKLIAPKESSGHFKIYQHNILPILKFCEEMEGICA